MIIALLIWFWLVGVVLTYAWGDNHVFYGVPRAGDWLMILGWPVTLPIVSIYFTIK